MSDYQLGKKVESIPTPEVIEDEYVAVETASGRLWRNTRTGHLSTDRPTSWRAIAEAMKRIREQQAEDGYPNVYWGSF